MRSPVNWALLGLVIQRPSYGYELVQRFERTYGESLELSSPSQIYTALDSLTRRGLIEEVPFGEGPDFVRQPKPHYKATEEGASCYERWLLAQLDEDRRRSRLFAQQFAVLGPEAALRVLALCEQACLKEASRLPAGAGQAGGEGVGGLVERLVGEEDRLRVGAKLSWTEYARRELKVLLHGRDRSR